MSKTYIEVQNQYKQSAITFAALAIMESSTQQRGIYLNIIESEILPVIDIMHKVWAFGNMTDDRIRYYQNKHKQFISDHKRLCSNKSAKPFDVAHLDENTFQPMHQIIDIARTVHMYEVTKQKLPYNPQQIILLVQNALQSDSQILALRAFIQSLNN